MTHFEIRAECGMAVAWSVELASIKRPVVARVNPDVRGAPGRGLPLNRSVGFGTGLDVYAGEPGRVGACTWLCRASPRRVLSLSAEA